MSAEMDYTSTTPLEQRGEDGLKELVRLLGEKGDFEAADQFWSAVQENINERLGHRKYSLWFHQTELMSFSDGELVVGVPNIVIRQYLGQRYKEAVKEAVEELLGERVEVRFDVAPRLFRRMEARREERRREEESAPDPRPVDFDRVRREARVPDDWGFENLVVTASNRLPYAAARELAGQENPRFSFVFFCGDYGLGKTAMLRAVYALAAGPERRLDPLLVSAEDWCNEYYHAIQKKTTRQFRRRYRNCDMLLVDDVQFVQGKEGGQRELLHTVKHILGNGGRVALASKPHPDEMRDLDPGFRALTKRAFPAVIRPPSGEERMEIVRRLADRHGLKATQEVYRYVARQKGHSFAAVDSAVCCLAMYAGVHGSGKLDLPGAMDAFAAVQPTGSQQVGLDEVKQAVLEVFDVEPAQLTGKSRRRTVLLARQVGMLLARRLTGASLTEVARFFGRSSHSTVKHAVEKIEDLCEEDSHIAGLVRRLERRLSHA